MGSYGNPATTADSIRLIEAALDQGVTLFDTANIYGQGDSEKILGRALRGKRDDAFIITKIGQRFSQKMRLLRPFKTLAKTVLGAARSRTIVTGRRAANMKPQFEISGYAALINASLRRLTTDRVDALLLHSPPAPVIGDGDVKKQLTDALGAGKILSMGVSCDDLEALVQTLENPEYSVIEAPAWLLAAAHRDGVFQKRNLGGRMIVAREVLRSFPDLPPGSALKAVLGQPPVTAVLVGTTSIEHLTAAVGALR